MTKPVCLQCLRRNRIDIFSRFSGRPFNFSDRPLTLKMYRYFDKLSSSLSDCNRRKEGVFLEVAENFYLLFIE